MSATLALLLLTSGQSQPEVAPRDPAAARQLVREGLTLYGVGVVRQRPDSLREAARCLEDAVRLDPEAVPPRQVLVLLYTALGRPTDAVATAAAVVQMDPSRAETWRTLARLLHQMKRTDEAIAVLIRCVKSPALADQPADRSAAYRELARLYSAIGAHAEAVKVCRLAVAQLSAGPDKAEVYALLATESLAAGSFLEARDAALEARDGFRKGGNKSRAIDLTPTLAAAYAGLGDRLKAQTLLDEHLSIRKRDLAAFALKAKLHREAGEPQEAIAMLTFAVANDPDFVPLRVLLADEYRKAGERERARLEYSTALQRQADVAAYRGLFAVLSGPGGSGLEMLNLIDAKVREARPERDDNNNVPEGPGERERRDKAAEHARAITAALRQEPAAAGFVLTAAATDFNRRRTHAYETWWLLAGIAERTGLLATAEDLFEATLATAGQNDQLRISEALIRVLWAQRKREDVVAVCARRLKDVSIQVYWPYYRGRMALALVQLGKSDKAIAQADLAVKEAHGSDILNEKLRRIEILKFAEMFDRAEAECRALLETEKVPADVQQVRHTLSAVYSSARQFDKAEEQLRLILELDPADASAHNSLGYQLADQGRNLDEAERLVRRALELDRAKKSDSLEDDGESGHYLDSLGWVLFRRGRFAEAKELIERAAGMPVAANVAEVWDHLGDVCARLNQPGEAAAAWQRALELSRTEKTSINDPRGAEVERKLKRLRRPD